MALPTLKELSKAMRDNVHKFDGEFPYDVMYDDDENTVTVSLTDMEGVDHRYVIDKVDRYDDVHQRFIVESTTGFHYYLTFYKEFNPF